MIAFLIYLISARDSLSVPINLIGSLASGSFIITLIWKTLEEKRLSVIGKTLDSIIRKKLEDEKSSIRSIKDKNTDWYDIEDFELASIINKISKPFVILLIISLFTPNSKTIAAMYLVPKIIENKQVSELPDKMLKLLNVKMDDWISDLAGEEKKD